MRTNLEFFWQLIGRDTRRAKVVGGWLVLYEGADSETMVFIKDSDHEWTIKMPDPEPDLSEELPRHSRGR